MKLIFFIARRYLSSRKKENIISIITAYSVLGIAVGVAALIIVISVMSGFERDLQNKILGMNGDIIVTHYFGYGIQNYEEYEKKLKQISAIKGITPFIYTQSMIQSTTNISGVVVRGVDFNKFNKVSNVLHQLVAKTEDITTGAVLGKELAKKISVTVGDTIFLITNIQPTGLGYQPVSEAVPVSGIFNSGMYEYDIGVVFISLQRAQQLFNLPGLVTGFEIRTDEPFNSHKIAAEIEKIMPYPYQVRTWMEINKNLFSALKLERVTMFIILLLIIIVAGFNIISTIVMMVLEKKKEIALLRAIGLTQKDIKHIFVLQGLYMGVIGTVIGNLLGIAICFLLKKYHFITLPADVYYISTIPVYIQPLNVLFVSVAAIFISFVSSVYPAWRASKILPVEGLRNE